MRHLVAIVIGCAAALAMLQAYDLGRSWGRREGWDAGQRNGLEAGRKECAASQADYQEIGL